MEDGRYLGAKYWNNKRRKGGVRVPKARPRLCQDRRSHSLSLEGTRRVYGGENDVKISLIAPVNSGARLSGKMSAHQSSEEALICPVTHGRLQITTHTK